MATINFTVEREVMIDGEVDLEEIDLEIEGVATPYSPARLSGHPDTWCPAEGGEVEIEYVLLNGKPWDGELTDSERQYAEEELREAARIDAEEDRAEAQIAAWEDRQFDKYDRYNRW